MYETFWHLLQDVLDYLLDEIWTQIPQLKFPRSKMFLYCDDSESVSLFTFSRQLFVMVL